MIYRKVDKSTVLKTNQSWRGSCHGNAVADSFFHLPKSENVRRKTYKTCQEARRDVSDYLELFYNSERIEVTAGCYNLSNLIW